MNYLGNTKDLTSFGHSDEFRCHEFTAIHGKAHYLFAGCSITCGQYLDKEDTWAYKVFERMSVNDIKPEYYNISVPGFAATNIVYQCFKYFKNYGNPNKLFVMLPNPGRDYLYINRETIELSDYIQKEYLMLEQYCLSNNIKLFSFTWSIPELRQSVKALSGNKNEDHWEGQIGNDYHSSMQEILNDFETFHVNKDSGETILKKLFNYYDSYNDKDLALLARDGEHPGKVMHDYWADFVMNNAL